MPQTVSQNILIEETLSNHLVVGCSTRRDSVLTQINDLEAKRQLDDSVRGVMLDKADSVPGDGLRTVTTILIGSGSTNNYNFLYRRSARIEPMPLFY
jgi:hypothetical protein